METSVKESSIQIIGTSHISKQSINEISKCIESQKPDIVAVELDNKRYHALMQKKKGGFPSFGRIGITGYIFALIGHWAEKKLGESVGVSPGSEMMHAIKLAKKHSLRVAFIDQDIEITLKRLSKSITWKEKRRFIADLFKAIFMGKKQAKELGLESFDLSKVPEKKVIDKLMDMLKHRYPNVYNVLLKERNNIMARNLMTLASFNPGMKILAVVGAGHEDGIKEIIDKNSAGKIDYTFSINIG